MANLRNRFYWVARDRLLAGYYPGALEPETADLQLQCLLDAGIRHMVNLMEPHEKTWYGKSIVPYKDRMRRLADHMDCRITFERRAIKDLSVPRLEKMRLILDHIDVSIANGKPVYVHCLGGIGRTGTVIGCYLIRHGVATGENVLGTLRALRRSSVDSQRRSPESDEQIEFVRAWQAGL